MSSSSVSVRSRESIKDSLYQVRLLSALRSGDPAQIHPFLADIGRDRRSNSDAEGDLGATALHLAIRCASCDTILLLLSNRSISPNAIHPPGSGQTALHLAASLGRADAVNLLLDQEGIDDTLRDSQGRTCLTVAKGKETVGAIRDSRAFLTASYRSLLRTYVFSPPSERMPDALIKLLSSPRAHLLELSYLDDDSGTTILHEAARRKDFRAIELAVRAGADVFVRDRKGRTVSEACGKDDRVKAFLRQYANQDSSLIEPPSFEPPELKGYLNKYTNVAKGYNTRWFVLRNGVLSYYRHQEDEGVSSRGSIAMKTAQLKSTPGSGGLRFEVHSTPARGHHTAQKWYMKANHPVEASRWMQALTKSIEWSRRDTATSRRSGESETSSLAPPASLRTPSLSYSPNMAKTISAAVSTNSVPDDILDHQSDVQHGLDAAMADEQRDHNRDAESSMEETERHPPHEVAFQLQGNTTVAQMELTAQMLTDLLKKNGPLNDASKGLQDSMTVTQNMLSDYVNMVREREDWWKEELERERQRQNVWEESLRAVVKEGELLETELKNRSRRRSKLVDTTFTSVSELGTLKNRPSYLALASPPLQEEAVADEELPTAVPVPASVAVAVTAPATARQSPVHVPSPLPTITHRTGPLLSPTGSGSLGRRFSLVVRSSIDQEDGADTDEEDEFFDAIESNTLPNLVVNESLTGKVPQEPPSSINVAQYENYRHLRQRLAITSDDRPPMSLWAVLKNSIGKDLTKISFPVFFNEPTSMLQRMAEDMEFSECLDAAVKEDDPHRRIAFVAAFAMSNYSSTIGRIAKPFNPMLSETFEYVRFDKEYRYVSEQVSHHPPMSACWADSPSWNYYGEVDAQNKFMGKSFEIRPTGVAHAELLLDEKQEPSYPKCTYRPGKVIEHYSWKKVTTNISGFILGSPTIDHYGDMIVTNHRTKDQCVLTFKPRGWRGRDAYEISGYVMDSDGNVTYEIAGRWNSQLVARAVGTGVGSLHPDVSVPTSGFTSPKTTTPEYILLWRNSEKPVAPFNLTPFAITLNDCPPELKPNLCPTDCRLRPDQRAFELGKYERANELKNMQEEYQRATRRAREEGKVKAHKPRWFIADTEPDTGERVWTPARTKNEVLEYWAERERVYLERKAGNQDVRWNNVDRIFIEDDP
ncbi:Oxysterol-binding protein-domain-containing protein [Cristinia sonorae]|uniref:Oxysterol-binding protein-domain-containing protein n=1 Tax=Cristinia sonorae TaxID=1940300 RepID=A0A8K0UHV0_9AGAR|nr:Oxysterol-binding protein-domain-containing protein [Cristinia sonorae]